MSKTLPIVVCPLALVGQAFPQQPSMTKFLGLLILKEVIKIKKSQHFLPPPCITKHVTSYLTCTLPKSYTGNRIGFAFFSPGESFPLFKYSAASLAQPQVCGYSAATPIQQWVPASERTNLFLTLPPSPF